jgi:hypothetical protein
VVKRPERKAQNSRPYSADVNNELNFIPTLPYVFMAYRLTIGHLPFLSVKNLEL